MVKKSRFRSIKYGLGIVGLALLFFVNSPVEAAASNDSSVSLLNPFSLQVIQVQPRANASVVVLRSTTPRSVGALNQQAPSLGSSLTSQSSGLVFRNSVVRIPLMPEVRSPSSPG